MKKMILLSLFLTMVITASAQSLERQAVGAAGGFTSASWGSLSSTTGEVLVNTLTATSNVLTQGFQQPAVSDFKVMVYNIAADNFSVQVYPNPASNIINVVINSDKVDKHYLATVYDLPGQRIDLPYENISSGTQTHMQFDIRQLAVATYMILITDENNMQVKAVRITKTN